MGIASLVLGIISFIFAWIPFITFVPAIVGLTLGIVFVKKKEIEKKGIGIAGIVLNSITLSIAIIYSVVVITGIVTYINNAQNEVVDESSSIDRDKLNDALGDIYDALSESVKDQIDYNRLDDVSGNKWQMNDNSLIILNKDNTFYWYKDADVLNNNYYSGTYKVYQGENAIRYIANELPQYGLTEEKQRNAIDRGSKYHVYNYYCLVLENEKCMVDGINTMKTPVISPYWGFYFNENGTEILDFASMNSGNYNLFTKVK